MLKYITRKDFQLLWTSQTEPGGRWRFMCTGEDSYSCVIKNVKYHKLRVMLG